MKKSQQLAYFSTLFLFLVATSLYGQAPAGNNQEIQFNNNGSFGASSKLKWDGNNLKFLDMGTVSAKLYLESEGGDYSYIFSENYGTNSNRLVFHTWDDGDNDYAVFRNGHWNDGNIDVFEIHRTYTMANSNFYVLNGNVGVGTTSPIYAKLQVRGGATHQLLAVNRPNNDVPALYLGNDGTNNAALASNNSDLTFGRDLSGNYSEYLRIQNSSGNVGIGTTTPDEKLSVNGNIHTKEVRVDLTGWSDFVFNKDYELPTLQDVEKHIKEKGHLQNIPSAEEVEENGILLGDMNAKLLQKIEELMLYTIEQEKEIETLKKKSEQIEKLENENEVLKLILNEVESLKNELKNLKSK